MDYSNRPSGSSMIVPIILGGVFIIVGGLLISQLAPSAFAAPASAEAEQIDALFTVLLGIGGAIFLLVQGLLLYSIIRFRAKPGDMSDGPTIHGNTLLELIWTAIPAVIVLFLVIYSYSVWTDITQTRSGEQTVLANGARFAWTFEYDVEYDDPQTGTAQTMTISSPELHTYIGQPVRMELTTQDVNHAFWVPEMRMKQDLLAGRQTEVRFTPVQEGRYRVVCAELCGSGHGLMYSYIIVHPSREEYLASFVDPAVQNILFPPPDPAIRGGTVIQSYPCSGCHVLVDERYNINWSGQTGPSLQGIADRAGNRRPGFTAEQYIANSIYHPGEYLVPGYGNLMNVFQNDDPAAAYYMPTEDLEAITAYLCTISDTAENTCDLENLVQYIRDTEDPNYVPIAEQAADAAPESTAEGAAEPTAEATPGADAAEATAAAEGTVEATAEATGTP
ncbi:MAG: cytochrome c oxidase subunit II [bacterium]|nr:cytochrome c oxidase subunit II [bacterium]